MGNTNSAGIVVRTERVVYAGGETVNGHVYIDILNPVHVNSLSLRIKGKEKTHWTETRTRTVNGKSETFTESYFGNHQIFKVMIPIAHMDPNMPFMGQYQYPFSFVLPTGIPGTANIRYGGATGSINYQVKAVLDVVGMFKSNFRYRQPLFITQPPPFIDRLQSSYSGNVTIMCCCNRGTVNMSIVADKNSYTSGEVSNIVASIQNNSRKPFKRIVAELIQHIELRARGHYRCFTNTVAKNVYPGIAMMTSDLNRQLSLPVPPNTDQNALGYIVRLYYTLNVRADLAWGKDPTCATPICIYAPTQLMQATCPVPQIVAPPGYAPVVQQPVVLNVPNIIQPPPMFTINDFNVQPVGGQPVYGNNMQASAPPQQVQNDFIRTN
jgi:hypothetical protein